MFRRLVVGVLFSLSPFLPFSLSPSADARDFTRGPLIVSLSPEWAVTEEPGPELLKATLGQTATLALWKYNSGVYSPEQFLSGLRGDLGWTLLSEETLADPRFGRTHIGLYQKIGRLDEKPFTIRSCDFVLDGEIYMLVMSAPEAQFAASDTEFRKVFEGLSNMSGAVRPAIRPVFSSPLEEVAPLPSSPSRGEERIEAPPQMGEIPTFDYDLVYELPDGSRLGFQVAQKTASVIDPNGKVRTAFPLSGVPYISPGGVYVLSEEYAYRLDPSTGNVIGRLLLVELLRTQLSAHSPQPPAPSIQPALRSPQERKRTQAEEGVKSIIQRAAEIHGQAGVKPAIDYMMAQRGSVDASGSVHLYEFYFRLGEYWEETGDLETALAYYRLATKAID